MERSDGEMPNPPSRRHHVPTPIYFDNAATTFPKPQSVRAAAAQAILEAGGNPGRGGHILARRAGDTVYHARETAAEWFGAQPEHVVFTLNCTHALNLAIWGLLRTGGHAVISSLEHNSVYRPIAALARSRTITYNIAQVSSDNEQTLANFRRLLRPDTRAVICSLVSNVTGQILPFRELAAICAARGIAFIADGAQGCGILPVKLSDGINILCTAGHKGLYGLMGSGMLITDGTYPLIPLMQGGTGSFSMSAKQPDFLPDALEAGTVAVPAIAALDAGMQFIEKQGISHIFRHESMLCERLLQGLRRMPNITVYREPNTEYAPVVSFIRTDEAPADTAARLAEQGFCVRAGIHCSPLAHNTLGTSGTGTVRFAPSVFSTIEETDAFLRAL